jgi:hypothetical protein
MIRHAGNLSGAADGPVIRKIKNREPVELRDHGKPPVLSGCFHMLPESIPIPQGTRPWNRSQ